MVVNFIYSQSNIVLLILFCLIYLSINFVGLWLVNRFFANKRRFSDSAALSGTVRPVASVFAVLLAFIAIGTLTTYHNAELLAQEEVAIISSIQESARALPPVVRQDIETSLLGYMQHVIEYEWPSMRKGDLDLSAKYYLNVIYAHAAQYKLDNTIQLAIFSQMIERLNRLYEVHRQRALMATAALQPTAWIVLLASGLLTIFVCFIFKMRSSTMQYCATSSVALVVGLLTFLVVAFDRPFRGGETAIEPTSMISKVEEMQQPSKLPPGVSPVFSS